MTLRILAFEDSATMTEILKRTFAAEDVVLRVSADGYDVAKAVTAFSADVVLVDSTLPDADSEQICRVLRARFPLLPLILMHGGKEPAVGAERLGASGACQHV